MVKWILFLSAAILLTASVAPADNITIFDGIGETGDGIGIGGEDDEVEPDMINNQSWDLESFELTGNDLGIIAGFDLKDGRTDYDPSIVLGDIFIAVPDDDPASGFDYDYAIKLDFDDLTYNIYELTDESSLTSVYDYNSPESDPFTLELNGESIIKGGYGSFTYTDFGGIYGDEHNAIDGIDLSCLDHNGTDFIAHVTMSCGNDNMMGEGATTAVPEPSTFSCLILGLSLLAGTAVKRKHP